MERAVYTGTPLKRKRPLKQVISEQQRAILRAVREKPGLSEYQLHEYINYATLENVKRAIQGLIRRGYLQWESNPVTKNFRYSISYEGVKKLAETP